MESVATSSAASAAVMDMTDAVSVGSSSVSSFQNAQLIAATFGFDTSSTAHNHIATSAAPVGAAATVAATATTVTSNNSQSSRLNNIKSAITDGVLAGNSGAGRRRTTPAAHDEEDESMMADDADSDIMGTVSSRDVTSIEEDYFSDVAMSADQDTHHKDTGERKIRKQAKRNYKEPEEEEDEEEEEEEEDTRSSRKSLRKSNKSVEKMPSGDEATTTRSPRKNSLQLEKDKESDSTFQAPKKRGRPAKAAATTTTTSTIKTNHHTKKSKEDDEGEEKRYKNKTVASAAAVAVTKQQAPMTSRSSSRRSGGGEVGPKSESSRRESPRIKVKTEMKEEEEDEDEDYTSNNEDELYVKKAGFRSTRLNARGGGDRAGKHRSGMSATSVLQASLAARKQTKQRPNVVSTTGKVGRKKVDQFVRKSASLTDNKVKEGKVTILKRLGGRKKRRGRKPRNYTEDVNGDEEEEDSKTENGSSSTEQMTSGGEDENSQSGGLVSVSDPEMKEDKTSSEKKRKSPTTTGVKTPEPLTVNKPVISLNSTYKVRIMPRRVSLSTHDQSASTSQSQTSTTIKTEPSSSFIGGGASSSSVPSSPLKTVKSSSSLLSLTPGKHLSSTSLPGGAASITNTIGGNAVSSGNILTNQSSTSSNGSSQPTNSDKQENNSSSSQQQHKFECPECDKKFYSYFGLVQHIDQHPTLSVTCSLCEITFETHQALVAHSMNIHGGLDNVAGATATANTTTDDSPATPPLAQSDSMDIESNNKTGDSDDRKPITTSTSHTQANSVSPSVATTANFGAKTSSSHTLTTNTIAPTTTGNSSQSAKSLQAKTKSLQEQDLLFGGPDTAGGVRESDLLNLAVPSIMTRTSRQQNSTKQLITPSISQAIAAATTNGANNSTTPATLSTNQATSHLLTAKTSGFADLAFIDISCTHFPRIAQNYCELWPRKLQRKQQALHNYKCSMCGFYFPTRASLILHKMKKKFATSKLLLGPNTLQELENTIRDELAEIERPSSPEDKKGAERSRPNPCELFMTNSKYLDYERTLDEVITKIEEAEKPVSQSTAAVDEETFMSWFGLVEANKAAQIQQQSHVEKLLLKLRKQLMLEINYQFNVELDRWRLTHSSAEQFNQFHNDTTDSSTIVPPLVHQYSNKIYLKPSVNLNRPLLIRSKKLKRSTNGHTYTPLPSFNTTNKATNSKTAANLKSSSTVSSVPEKTTNRSSKQSRDEKVSKPLFPATSGAFSGTAASSASKQSNQSKAAQSIATAGQTLDEEMTGGGKKRRRKQQLSKLAVDQPDEIENINVAKSATAKSNQQQQHQQPAQANTSTVNAFKRVKSEIKTEARQISKPSLDNPPVLNKNLPGGPPSSVARNGARNQTTASNASMVPPQPPKLFRMPNNHTANNNITNSNNSRHIETENSSSNSSLSSSSSTSGAVGGQTCNNSLMPAPPTLYKAPKNTSSSSAAANTTSSSTMSSYHTINNNNNNSNVVNSSRFASASGMNFNLFKNGTNLNSVNRYNNMPKLTPVVNTSTGHVTTTATNGGQPTSITNGQLTSPTNPDLASAMPKLKPILPKPRQSGVGVAASYSNKSSSKIQNNNNIPHPPSLVPAASSLNHKSTMPNGGAAPPAPMSLPLILNRSRLNHASTTTAKSLTPPGLPTSSKTSVLGTASAAAAANATSTESDKDNTTDGLSLKCKFCRGVFKQQQSFFHHVIVDHAAMLKLKLDRAGLDTSTVNINDILQTSGNNNTDNAATTTTCSTGRNSF